MYRPASYCELYRSGSRVVLGVAVLSLNEMWIICLQVCWNVDGSDVLLDIRNYYRPYTIILCASKVGPHKYLVWLCMRCCLQLRTIILPVVSYGCENWSLTLREERRLWVFENRVPRRIFGPKRNEVTGEWRKLHDEELNDLYCSPNITRVIKSRRMRWAGHVTRMGDRRIL